MAHPQSAGQPIVLHRCAALHQGSAHHLARVTLSQQLKICRTSWQFHFCTNDADDALRLLLVMGTHRHTGETPSVPDFRSSLVHQPLELVLAALLPEIPAASIAFGSIFPPSPPARNYKLPARAGPDSAGRLPAPGPSATSPGHCLLDSASGCSMGNPPACRAHHRLSRPAVPGRLYVFHIRAVSGLTGYSDWSDPVSHRVL